MNMRLLWLRLVIIIAAALAADLRLYGAEAHAGKLLLVANTAGDSLSVIDLARQEVTGEIPVGKHPHGLALSINHRKAYCSIESEKAVKVVDTLSRKILASIPLTGVPNQLAVSGDGQWVYVAINDKGAADIIDLKQEKVVKTVAIGQRPHNCYSPRDGRHMYVTAIRDNLVKQFDFANGHKETMTIRFDGPVRPLCITQDETKLFVALEGLHGFGWADLRNGRQIGRMAQPLPPLEQRSKFAYMNTHGLELRPGDKELWVTSFIGNGLMVFDITGERPVYKTTIAVGDAPNWLTFSGDGQFAYSANAGANSITIVDCEKGRAVKEVKVGAIPKRLLEVDLSGAK